MSKNKKYGNYTNYKLAVLRRYKSMVGCDCCGVKDFRVLQFDHTYPHKKQFNIGQARQPLRELAREMKFCSVLCANCHSLKGWENKDLSTRRYRNEREGNQQVTLDVQG